MDTLARVLAYYVFIGMAVYPAVVICEIMVSVIRGSSFVAWVQMHLTSESPKKLTWGGAMRGVLAWPVLIIMWAIAAIKGRTMIEHGILWRQEAADHQRKLIAEAKRMWGKHSTPMGELFTAATRFGDTLRITHVATHAQGKIICWRAMPDPVAHRPIPWLVTSNPRKAREACMADQEWLDLCSPGREDAQLRMWQETIDRLGPED